MGRLSLVGLALALAMGATAGAAGDQATTARAAFADAQTLSAANHPAEAATRLDAAVAADPTFADAWFALGLARRKAGQCAPAVAAYRRYAERRPGESEPYYGMGLCLRTLGDRPGASAAMQRYLELEHRPETLRWQDNARAVVSALRAEQQTAAPPPTVPLPAPGSSTSPPPLAPAGPSPAAGIYSDAQALRDSGRVDEAIGRFKQAIAADPTFMPARAALGEFLVKLHRDEQAVTVFQAAVRQNATYPLAWYELAFTLRARGRLPEAVDAYQTYIKLRPTDPDPYYGLGRSLQRLGRGAEARAAFEKYLALETRPGEDRWVKQARAALAELR